MLFSLSVDAHSRTDTNTQISQYLGDKYCEAAFPTLPYILSRQVNIDLAVRNLTRNINHLASGYVAYTRLQE
jgi:hypothetical protein